MARIVTPADAVRLQAQGFATIIDIRPHFNYSKGHIKGAVSVAFNLDTMAERIRKVTPKNNAVILLCDGEAQLQSTVQQVTKDKSIVLLGTCCSKPDEWQKAGLAMQALQVL